MRLRGTGVPVVVVYDRPTVGNLQPTQQHHLPCQQRMAGTALGSRFVEEDRDQRLGPYYSTSSMQ